MQPYTGAYPNPPGATQPPMPGQAPMSSPFGAAPAGGVRASPFGAPGAAAPTTSPFGGPAGGVAPPPTGPFGGGTGAVAPPPPGGVAPPPTGPFGGGVAPPPMAAASAPPPAAGGMAAPPMAGATSGPGAPAGFPGGAPGGFPAPAPADGGFGLGQPQPGRGQDVVVKKMSEDIDAHNCPLAFMRATVSKLPSNPSMKGKLPVPLGVVIQPLAPTEQVATVNFGTNSPILRCRTCRSYINPFVRWESSGRRWTCNLCGQSQATPDNYYAHLDQDGRRSDRFDRPEIAKGAVEFVAPGEYMVRPPQPPVFLFLINVSHSSVASGMVDVVVAGIKEAIQEGNIPGGQRTMVGVVTYDTSLHFYNLNPNLSQPQMLVVSDLDDIFIPLPEGVLVNLSDSQESMINLLDQLPNIFGETQITESCLGSAVKGGYEAIKQVGGKLLVFDSCISSAGANPLKSTRDNPRMLNTDREVELLRPVSDGHKEFSTELTKAQITVELFLGAQAYIDLASIAPLAKYTGGDIRYYPQFHIHKDGIKMKNELVHVLTRHQGWEAVMRVRASKGWKVTECHGHLMIRGQDLMVVPCCHADQTFGIGLDIEDSEGAREPFCCIQSALLYTNSDGERRIRVNTWGATIALQGIPEILGTVDVQATMHIVGQMAIKKAFRETMGAGRELLNSCCRQIVQAQSALAPGAPGAEALQFLPLFLMGALKSSAFRATADVPVDYRGFIWSRIETLPAALLSRFFSPRLMSLHDMPPECGTEIDGQVQLPPALNATSESMKADGVYLVEDGESMIIWVGSTADAVFVSGAFGVPSVDQLDGAQAAAAIGAVESPVNQRLAAVCQAIRDEHQVPHQQVYVCRQGAGSAEETRFFSMLIEDRTPALQMTFMEFLQRNGYRPPAAPAPGATPPPMMGGPPPMGR